MPSRKFIRLCFATPLLISVLVACTGCEADIVRLHDALEGKDRIPPVLLSIEAVGTMEIRCSFDESVVCDESSPWKINDTPPARLSSDGNEVTIVSPVRIPLGGIVTIEGKVKDLSGNTTWFSSPCWGYNDKVPPLLINEFTTKGTDANPDRTELKVLENGNIAGVTLSDGPEDMWEERIVLPDQQVQTGDFIIIWWKGVPTETSYQGENGHRVYSYTVEGKPGLPGNNGLLVLSASPAYNAKVLDTVVYTNHTTTTFDGFGNRELQQKVRRIVEMGFWKCDKQIPDGSCGVDSSASTATRSICRDPGAPDTDSPRDWHVTPTKGASFGKDNTTERFTP